MDRVAWTCTPPPGYPGCGLVGESLKVHPTARLPGLRYSGREPEGTPPQAGYPVRESVSESLKVYPTGRLPELRVSGPGSLDMHPTGRLPGLAVGEREPEGTPHSQATRSGSW